MVGATMRRTLAQLTLLAEGRARQSAEGPGRRQDGCAGQVSLQIAKINRRPSIALAWIAHRPHASGQGSTDGDDLFDVSARPDGHDVALVRIDQAGKRVACHGGAAGFRRVDGPRSPQLSLERARGHAERVAAEQAVLRAEHGRVHRQERQDAQRADDVRARRVDLVDAKNLNRRVDGGLF
jgi:hypothetical protein